MIEMEFETQDGKVWREWIEEDQVDQVRLEAKAHGLLVRNLGPVSWQRQLARAESPEL